MRSLLYKEIRLALHPASVMFLALSAMLLIPNYPYEVVFFYSALGVFFTCQNGREYRDIDYCMTLPIGKREIVKARFATVICIQGLQLLLAVPFALIRRAFVLPNEAGMDAGIALFAEGFMMMGAFNIAFFPRYYSAPEKVGRAFAVGSTVVGVLICAFVACTLTVPWCRDVLDTTDGSNLPDKLSVLAGGAVVYAALTAAAYHISVKRFEPLDL